MVWACGSCRAVVQLCLVPCTAAQTIFSARTLASTSKIVMVAHTIWGMASRTKHLVLAFDRNRSPMWTPQVTQRLVTQFSARGQIPTSTGYHAKAKALPRPPTVQNICCRLCDLAGKLRTHSLAFNPTLVLWCATLEISAMVTAVVSA